MAGEPIGVLIREASPAVRTGARGPSPRRRVLGLTEKLSGLVGIGQDLEPADLFVAAEPPDVDDWHLSALIALLDVPRWQEGRPGIKRCAPSDAEDRFRERWRVTPES
jgi:hypothetical protein